MICSLFPFPARNLAGGPDVIERLRRRGALHPAPRTAVPAVALLERTVELLRGLSLQFAVDYCVEDDGFVRLAVVATDLERDMALGDTMRAGLHIEMCQDGRFPAFVAERLFRVVCANGAFMEFERKQTAVLEPASWDCALEGVVARSFSVDGFDRDAARFRAATSQMLVAPYELLCHLAARRIISDAERSLIQHEFTQAEDATLYGFINAVTRVAGRLREDDAWKRSIELERLGGEILRGDHQPPVGELAWRLAASLTKLRPSWHRAVRDAG
jgi:hypothetical protein